MLIANVGTREEEIKTLEAYKIDKKEKIVLQKAFQNYEETKENVHSSF